MPNCIVVVQFDLPKRSEEQAVKGGISTAPIYRGLAQKNPKLSKFMKGWMNRLNALRAEVGVPGFAAPRGVDFGGSDFIAKVEDLPEGADLERWQ